MEEKQKLNPIGEWFGLIRSCDCGSGKPFEYWVKDEQGKPIFKVCKDCKTRKIKRHEQGGSK